MHIPDRYAAAAAQAQQELPLLLAVQQQLLQLLTLELPASQATWSSASALVLKKLRGALTSSQLAAAHPVCMPTQRRPHLWGLAGGSGRPQV